VKDIQGRYLLVNKRFEDAVGLTRENLIGKLDEQIFSDEEAASFRKNDQEVLKAKSALQFEEHVQTKDGIVVWSVVDKFPLFDGTGNVLGTGGIATDITERKRALEQLQKAEEKARLIIDTALDAVIAINSTGRITEWSSQAELIFGWSRREAIGQLLSDTIIPYSLRANHKIGMETFLASGVGPILNKRIETVALHRDGHEFPVELAIAPLKVGSEWTFSAFLRDLTEKTKTEEALRASEARFRAAIDGIAGLVAIMAPSGELESVNSPLTEYFGRNVEELKNWGTSDAVHPEDLPRVLEAYETSVAAGTPFHHELRLRRFDGEYRWFENRGAPIRDESGRITRWYCLLTDVEDRTQALARLQQMQSDFAHMNRVSVMGELAASLSHEITQPFASARNNARAAQNFLEMQPPDRGEVREALSCVVADVDRAGEIIDRIREQIKKAPPRKERFDLNAAINEVIILARSVTTRNGVSIQARLSAGLVPVLGDHVQIQQVLLNLILNAAEAMGSVEQGPRELLISTEQDQAGVLVAVRDSGPGIDSAYLDRVFDAFYTTKCSGTGMGLSICRSIIHGHGGKLWAETNEPRGAVFQFTLPVTDDELTSPLQVGHRTSELCKRIG
jgi:PAS domain S-box-containing protein